MGAGEFPSGGGEDHLMAGRMITSSRCRLDRWRKGLKKRIRFQRLVEELQTERLRVQGAERDR